MNYDKKEGVLPVEFELSKQREFYELILPLVDRDMSVDDVFENNTDGIVKGNLIEMKLYISDINAVLFQTIKYLSQMRVKGLTLPKNIILISLNEKKAYKYLASDYLEFIEKVYQGGASVKNEGFISDKPIDQVVYDNEIGLNRLAYWLKEEGTTKYHVNEECIIGLANRYYKSNPGADKADFLGDMKSKVKIIGEIRKPEFYKDTIYSYEETTNVAMEYIMDVLNPNFMQKDLGAFYTPIQYAKKSHELVYDAIRKHQESGNDDYVIIDTCAGTGNLQEFLNKDVPEDIIDKDVLSHCILNTYEYLEYKVLEEKFVGRVRSIIPPREKPDTFMAGLVRGSDALSEEFLENEYIKSFINDINPETGEHTKYTIIIFENPPYAETTSIEHQKSKKGKTSSVWKEQKAVLESKDKNHPNGLKGAESNDMANVFIWKAWNYYLRRPEDSLIVYSPVKYWKNSNWLDRKFVKGFGFNRRYFHTTTDTVVSCVLWENVKEENELDELPLKMYDIKDEKLVDMNLVRKVKKVNTFFSKAYYDKGDYSNDLKNNIDGLICDGNGEERIKSSGVRVSKVYNENIIAYLVAQTNDFSLPRTATNMTRGAIYNGNGFYLRSNNFLEKLPMFAAGWWSTYNDDWTLNGIIYRTGDGKEKFEKAINSKDKKIK